MDWKREGLSLIDGMYADGTTGDGDIGPTSMEQGCHNSHHRYIGAVTVVIGDVDSDTDRPDFDSREYAKSLSINGSRLPQKGVNSRSGLEE